MQFQKRKEFLEEFLKSYGVQRIIYNVIEVNKLIGTAIYDPKDQDEKQDFCWHMTEENVPSRNVLDLIKILNEKNYISIDKILVSENVLFTKTNWSSREEFDNAFNQIFEVEVRMIDDGEETDSYFLHT